MPQNSATPPNLIDALSGASSTLNNFTLSVAKIFDNGLNIVQSYAERVRAIRQINDEVIEVSPAVVSEPSTQSRIAGVTFSSKTLAIGAVAILAGGLLLSRFIK